MSLPLKVFLNVANRRYVDGSLRRSLALRAHRGALRRWSVLGCMLAALLNAGSGCKPTPPSPPPTQSYGDKHTVRPAKIVAQGQLLPAGGIIRMTGVPGDVVESINVSVGQNVAPGEPLLTLRSYAARKSQLDALKQQLEEVRLQKEAAIEKAQIELSAARMQLSQASEQAESVQRRGKSLPLLKQQWEDARSALQRAESLVADPLTRGMVSRLDIDKQRASVTASQLQYESQQESLELARDSAEWGVKLAKEKVVGAERSLALAQKADPIGLIEAQIKSAEQQLASSQLVSPTTGTIVSIDARPGESVAQLPLIQLADLSRMVCQVEIYQTDAPLVEMGQAAELRSDAFAQVMRGKVTRINRLVGYPQLRTTDPLAKLDYRTLPILVELDPEFTTEAARWLQLQVEVTIPLDGKSPSTKADSNQVGQNSPASARHAELAHRTRLP